MKVLTGTIFVFLFISPLQARELSYQGSFNFEHRQYDDDSNGDTYDHQTSLKGVFSAELEKEWGVMRLGGFFRDAYIDQERDFFNLDETYVKIFKHNWSLSGGAHVFNWRAMEFFSPLDTINPRNFDSMGEVERLGLPSLVLTREFDTSFLQLIYILKTPPSLFPQKRNRQGIRVNLEASKFMVSDKESSNNQDLFQYIARYKHTFDNFDLDIHFARKYDTSYPLISIDRPPPISPGLDDLEIRPYFFPVRQYGTAIQGNYKSWLLKLELAHYDFDNYDVELFIPPAALIELSQKDHTRLATGLERTFHFKNQHSGVFYFEYMSALGVDADEAKTLGAFQRDAMFGYRHSLNDFKGHELSLFVIHDLQNYDETLFSAGHSFRLSNAWKLAYTLTVIDAPKPDQDDPLEAYYGLKPLRESDNMLITLSRFF